MSRYNNPNFQMRPLCAALLVALAAPGVQAQEEETDNGSEQRLPRISVEANAETEYKVEQASSPKYTQPLLDTARTITVIPGSVMQDRGAESLRDTLRNVSGISLAAGEGGDPAGDSMHIRGFSARTDIFVDDIRDIAGYTRDVYNLEAVEVAKGPGSAVSGRGSTGGSVNLLTKTATRGDFTDVGLRLGTESDYRVTLDGNTQLGDSAALRVNLVTDDGEVAGRDRVENSKNAIALSAITGLGTDSRFVINAEYQKQDNVPDYGLPWVSNSATADPVAELAAYEGEAPPVDFSNYYGNLFRDYEEIEAQSITLRYESNISESTMLRAQARTGSVVREGIVSAPRFLDLTSSTDVRLSDEKTRDTEDSLQVLQLDLIGHYQTGGITHDVVAGVEVAEETFKRWNFVDLVDDNLDSTPETVDLFNPDPFVPFTGRYGRDGTRIEAVAETSAFYLFDTVTLSPQWEVTLGARSEKFETDFQWDFLDPSQTVNTSDSFVGWNFALVYKPAENGSIYFGSGNSFNPSAETLTVSTNTNSNLRELDPEETRSHEIGTKWDLLDRRLLLNAAVFRVVKTNARTDNPFFSGDQSAFDTLNGEQQIDGLEFSVTGQISEQWLLIAAYTHQNSEVTHAEGDDALQVGHELPRTPEDSASLWSLYDFNDRWAMGFGAQYLSERYNSSDPQGRERADSYAIFDMMVSYQAADNLELQLNGTNLADKEYEDQLGGGHFIPGEGRYIRMNARYTFD